MAEIDFDFAARDHQPPIEVWKAALGYPDELVALLRSGTDLGEWTRQALASYHAGELKVSKRRGRRRIFGLPQLLLRNPGKLRLSLAAQYYRDLMDNARSKGRAYGSAEKALIHVANEFDVLPDALRNAVSQIHRPLVSKPPAYITEPKSEADHFQRWLDLYGYDLMDEMSAKTS